MNNLIGNIGHIALSVVIIIAVTILALKGTITAAECLIVIAAAGGFSLGGAVASSPGTPAGTTAVTTTTSQASPTLGTTSSAPGNLP